MGDLELRKALAEAAGWEWTVDSYEMTGMPSIDELNYYEDRQCARSPVQGAGGRRAWFFRLYVDEPLSFDDVMAACEAAGARSVTWFRCDHEILVNRGKPFGAMVVIGKDPIRADAETPQKAIAIALIAAHREREIHRKAAEAAKWRDDDSPHAETTTAWSPSDPVWPNEEVGPGKRD